MASSVAKANSSSTLSTQLYSEIGGSLHPINWESEAKFPQSRLSGEARQLKIWIKQQTGQESQPDSLDKLFQASIQKWIGEKIKDLNFGKNECSDYMEMIRSVQERPEPSDPMFKRFRSTIYSDCHEQIDQHSQPPVFVDTDDGFVLVDDGADVQIALLNEWKVHPSRLLQLVPRVQAAFDHLKSTSTNTSIANK